MGCVLLEPVLHESSRGALGTVAVHVSSVFNFGFFWLLLRCFRCTWWSSWWRSLGGLRGGDHEVRLALLLQEPS